MSFSLLGLSHLSLNPASNNKSLQLGSAAGPQVVESPAENGSDPGKKRKRANVPAGEPGSSSVTGDTGGIHISADRKRLLG